MQYEYNQYYISYRDGTNHIPQLNALGKEGWEIISSVKIDGDTMMYLLKRVLLDERKLLK